jgi:hypothetical protein
MSTEAVPHMNVCQKCFFAPQEGCAGADAGVSIKKYSGGTLGWFGRDSAKTLQLVLSGQAVAAC